MMPPSHHRVDGAIGRAALYLVEDSRPGSGKLVAVRPESPRAPVAAHQRRPHAGRTEGQTGRRSQSTSSCLMRWLSYSARPEIRYLAETLLLSQPSAMRTTAGSSHIVATRPLASMERQALRTSVQLQSTKARTPAKTTDNQRPESKTNQQDREPCEICKTSIPGSNPGGASIFPQQIQRSGPSCPAKRRCNCSRMFSNSAVAVTHGLPKSQKPLRLHVWPTAWLEIQRTSIPSEDGLFSRVTTRTTDNPLMGCLGIGRNSGRGCRGNAGGMPPGSMVAFAARGSA